MTPSVSPGRRALTGTTGSRSAAQSRALIAGAALAERARGMRTRFVVRRGIRILRAVEQVDGSIVADNYLRCTSRSGPTSVGGR